MKDRSLLLKKFVAQTLKDVLGLPDTEAVDEQQGFFNLGMDSLMAVEVRNRLQNMLGHGIMLTPTLAIDYPNIAALSEQILALLFEEGTTASLPSPSIATRRDDHEPIAIIGFNCRFPKANTPEALWSLLQEERNAIQEIPQDRWDINAYYDPDIEAPGKMITRHSGFLEAIDKFDPLFFGISPREAEEMDPNSACS